MAITDDLIFSCPMNEHTATKYVCDFDGTDGTIRLDDAKGLFSIANDFSMSLWFKADNPSASTNYLIGATTSTSDRFAIRLSASTLNVGAQNGSGEIHKSVTFTDTASWHFLEVSYVSSSHTIAATLNGTTMTGTGYAYPSSVTGFSIGAKTDGSSNYFNGKISEVTSYNSAGYLNARWQLNDGSGTVAKDDWGNRYPGTLSGGVSFVTDSTAPEVQKETIFDRSGNNMHLTPQQYSVLSVDSGSGEYWREFKTNTNIRLWESFNKACGDLTTARASGWRTPGSWTFAFSFKRDDGTADDVFVGIWKTDTSDRSLMIRAIGGTFLVYWSTDGVTSTSYASTVSVGDTNEHNVVVKWNGTNLYINMDGTQDSFTPPGNYHSWPSTYYLAIGALPSAALYYGGKMRDATLWLRSISDTEEDSWIADQTIAQQSNPICDVYVLAGQSNSNQHGVDSDITAVDYNEFDAMWYMSEPGGGTYEPPCWAPGIVRSGTKYLLGRFGPETSFMQDMAVNSDKTVAVLHIGVGGTRLDPDDDEWYPGDTIYNNAITRLRQGMDELTFGGYDARIRGILWIHGESDATDNESSNYAGWMETFISTLREWIFTTMGYSDKLNIPFVLSKLSVSQYQSPTLSEAQTLAMQAAQDVTALNNTETRNLETDDLTTIVADYLHFDSDSTITLGKRLASTMTSMKGGFNVPYAKIDGIFNPRKMIVQR